MEEVEFASDANVTPVNGYRVLSEKVKRNRKGQVRFPRMKGRFEKWNCVRGMGFQTLQYQGVLHKELPCANCNDLFPKGISHAPGVEVQNQRVRPPKSRFNGPQKATETLSPL